MKKILKEKDIKELSKKVKEIHDENGVKGGIHDFLHVDRVKRIVELIASEEMRGLGVIAALLHNFDRVFGEEEALQLSEELLGETELTLQEKKMIMEAVRDHSKLNDSKDNPVTVILKDADRLDAGAIGIWRMAYNIHFPFYNSKNSFECRDTSEKSLRTWVDVMHRMLEWEGMLRLPKAKELGKSRFRFMNLFFKEFQRELKEIGVI